MNGQHSTWVKIEAGVPQGSTLRPFLFLIYINDLSDDLTLNPKLFVDDSSLLSLVQNVNSTTTTDLNNGLSEVSDWAFQWKMNFNPDPNKQAQEVIFSIKINQINHPPLLFNQNLVKSSSTKKHLGMILDNKLDFSLHLKNVQRKVNKTITVIRKLQNILPRESLITVYKSFIRPHLDYGNLYGRNKRNSKRKNLSRIRF